jgi:hypothetical protein
LEGGLYLSQKPFAYVSAPARSGAEDMKKIREYCRLLYEAGYTPLSPALHFPQFMNLRIPKERKAAAEMAQSLLRRCRVVVACGPTFTDDMLCELMLARRLNIMATTLDGILVIHRQKIAPQQNEPEGAAH